MKVLYIKPAPDLKPGDKVEAGKTPIGTAQDITLKYPPTESGPMTNHIHIQVRKDGYVSQSGVVLTLGTVIF